MPRPLPVPGLLAVLLVAGCGAEAPPGGRRPGGVCAAEASVTLVVLDVWGRPAVDPVVTGRTDGSPTPLVAGDSHWWSVGAAGLIPATVQAVWDGSCAAGGLRVDASDGARTAVGLAPGASGWPPSPRFTVLVGLDHAFFAASGRAPTEGNLATLLLDGQDYWGAVAADLSAAGPETRVHQSTWWWQSDFELVRGERHHLLAAEERSGATMLELLRRRGGHDRLLVARFAEELAPGLAYLNTDPELRRRGADPSDRFEVMLQGNPTAVPSDRQFEPPAADFSFVDRVRPRHPELAFDGPTAVLASALEPLEAASYHQKCLVVGGDVAYVSGMNVKSTDWDSSAHRVFDERRMVFDATAEERLAVLQRRRLPDRGPRKDYGVRLHGPAARDVDDVLRLRWDVGLVEGGMFAEDASPFGLLPAAPPLPGGVFVQVVVTLPEPIAERSILETQRKAIGQARDLVYVEDQYWRSPTLTEALVEAMEREPGLRLVVVTKPVAAADGGKMWTLRTDEELRSRFPDRYLLLQLQSFDREGGEVWFQPIDTHSKLLIVDDAYATVGSANVNERSLLYDGELNVAVLDRPWVADARARVLGNLVGPERAGSLAGAGGAELFEALASLAEANREAEEALRRDPAADIRPSGFVYPLLLTPDYLLEVGPDVF